MILQNHFQSEGITMTLNRTNWKLTNHLEELSHGKRNRHRAASLVLRTQALLPLGRLELLHLFQVLGNPAI